MKSQLLAALGISSIILGLYILIVYIINVVDRPNYHIGCYLSNPIFNNSSDFRQRIKKLTAQARFKTNLDTQIRNAQHSDYDLHKKSVQLTKSVEQYIKKLSLVKKYQQSNMDFFNELSLARANYKTCSQNLAQNFNSQQCKSLWSEYNQCFQNYTIQKNNLQQLYNKRSNFLVQIDELIAYDPSKSNEYDLQAELRRIKQKYDQKNSQIDKEKQKYLSELKRTQYKNQSKSNEYDQNQRQVSRISYQYEICLKNQKQFNKCEQIKRTIKQYGYSQSVESLQGRIRSKREVLGQMMKFLSQSPDNAQIKQMYNKRQQQLKHLLKLGVDMRFQETRQCGCTQSQKNDLKSQLQTSKIKLSQNLKELRVLSSQIESLEGNIRQTDRQRQNLINDFREQSQRITKDNKHNGYSLKQRLQILKKNLNQVNNQINLYSPKLNFLEFKCNQYKDRLSGKIIQSNEIANCLSKKKFFIQLRSKAKHILKKQDSTSQHHKKNILTIFESIRYPKALSIQAIKAQSQIEQISSTPDAQNVILQDASKQNNVIYTPQDEVMQENRVLDEISQEQIDADSGIQSQRDQIQEIEIKVEEKVDLIKEGSEEVLEIHQRVRIDVKQL